MNTANKTFSLRFEAMKKLNSLMREYGSQTIPADRYKFGTVAELVSDIIEQFRTTAHMLERGYISIFEADQDMADAVSSTYITLNSINVSGGYAIVNTLTQVKMKLTSDAQRAFARESKHST